MTVPLSTPSYNHYAGSDALSLYPITFPTFESDTVKAYISRIPEWDHMTVDGNAVIELVSGVDYDIVNLAKPNTAIQLLDASDVPPGWVGPIPARQEWLDVNGNLMAGFYLFVEFISNAVRPSTLAHGNQLIPALTRDLDRLAMHIKALDHKLRESYDYIKEAVDEAGSLPTGLLGDYLEYGADGKPQAMPGSFSGYSGTLGRQVNVASLTAAINALFDWQTFNPTMVLVFLGVGGGPFEKGVPVQVNNIQGTVDQGTALLVSAVINAVTGPGAAAIPDGPWNFTAPADFNPTGASVISSTEGPWMVSDNVTVAGTVTDADGKTGSASRSLSFVYPKFYGKTGGAADETMIKTLTKYVDGTRGKTLNAPAGTDYVYYAYPASLGNLTSITHSAAPSTNTLSGNWDLTTETFTMADGAPVLYNIYVTKTVSTTTTGQFTFS